MELVLHCLLAFVAAFRGWGIWAFALLAFSLAPWLYHASSGGDIVVYGAVSSMFWWLSLVGLVFMIAMGRDR